MKEVIEILQKQLDSTNRSKERFEKRAENCAKGSAWWRELHEAAKYAAGVAKGLEIAIQAIQGNNEKQ